LTALYIRLDQVTPERSVVNNHRGIEIWYSIKPSHLDLRQHVSLYLCSFESSHNDGIYLWQRFF